MADTLELTADSSKEEVAAYAEQVAKEVEQERAGEKAEPEQKSDAQIVSEQAGKPTPEPKETPAENTSGRVDTADEGETTAEVTDQGEETGPEWLDDDLKAEAAAYGIDESELADFASREEFERALRLFDKSALEAGRKALAESEGEGDKGPARNEKGQFAKKDETPEADDDTPEPRKSEGQYEITLDKDLYDDEIVNEFTRMRDHYESRLDALEQRFQDADAKAEEQHFDNLVDKLGHADLFGKTDSETPKQLERRQDLMVAVKAQQIGLERLGRPTEITESLINRVARMVFAEELGKKDIKQRTRKITKQSNGRQGGGVTRPQDPREDPRDEADRLYRELERA